WKVTAAGGTVEKVQGGDTVKFQAGDNLVVNQDRTTFTYGLAKDLKGLNSVTVGDENGVSTKITPAGTTVKDAAGNSTTINGGGMTITPADTAASPVSLTVDGLNNGGNKIHGVAPGTADTDAVNVSQLKASNAGLQEAVNRVGTETQRVGAHAAAMAALKPIQYDPLEPTQIMAGIGNYRGETAGAIGIAHYRTEDTMFNVGVSLGTSHNMVNAGVTHKFGGSRERKDAIPERYKAGPISSVYVMQDEVSSLKKENSNQKTVIANQAARLNTLEAENEQLKADNKKYKKELDIKDISKYEPISSTVIARNPDQWMNTVIIDKGAKSGIQNNMAVMTSQGLVGRVTKVNQFSAQVDLISTNARTGKLSVNIQHGDKKVFGLIDRYDSKKQELIISEVN
ncbi:MAG: rod shape-determining protein MreC, partial [Veillonella sp.]|nr:rod shape-determining protein MreC [Veillonella sp.]